MEHYLYESLFYKELTGRNIKNFYLTFSGPFRSDHSEGAAHFSKIQRGSLLGHRWTLDWPITWGCPQLGQLNSPLFGKQIRVFSHAGKQTHGEERMIIIIKCKWFYHDPSNNSPCGETDICCGCWALAAPQGGRHEKLRPSPLEGGRNKRHALWWGGGKSLNWEIVEVSLSAESAWDSTDFYTRAGRKKWRRRSGGGVDELKILGKFLFPPPCPLGYDVFSCVIRSL